MRDSECKSARIKGGVLIPSNPSEMIMILGWGTFLPKSPVGMTVSEMFEYREDLKRFMDKWHLWSYHCPRDPEKNHNQHDEGE